jgi:pyruvate dehydrogenase E1 component beta subunit
MSTPKENNTMQTLTIHDAIGQAIAEEMRRDPSVMMFGEGVATKRGDLLQEFGNKRIRNTPLAEGIIAGAAVGASAMGMRPVIDLLFAPFLTLAMDELVNSAGKLRYLSGGQFKFPLVAMAMTGTGWAVGAQHNHNLEAWFVHSPGLKVVMPSTAADFKGLMKTAIRDDNPVLFFVEMAMTYETGDVPDGEHLVPLGRAAVRRTGSDITLISYGKTVRACEKATSLLAEKGVFAEVIDLRSLKPLDEDAILASVRKTGRVLVVHEANRMCGVGAEVAAIVAEKAFDALKAPVLRLTSPDVPAPSSYPLELAFAPQADAIMAAAESLLVQSTNKAEPALAVNAG